MADPQQISESPNRGNLNLLTLVELQLATGMTAGHGRIFLYVSMATVVSWSTIHIIECSSHYYDYEIIGAIRNSTATCSCEWDQIRTCEPWKLPLSHRIILLVDDDPQ